MESSKFSYKWRNKNILVTEDIEVNYLFLEKVLSLTEVNVLRAQNGNEALSIVKNNDSIDLILMDIQMPGLCGFEITEAIKKIRPDLPIIIQTAFIIEQGRQRSVDAGADEYVEKPLNINKLYAIIEKYLGVD